jgi:polyamine oxidase
MPRKNTTRREFLSQGASFLATLIFGGYSIFATDKKKKVIVIGAGMSGLAAAKKLAAAGFQVTVLEARERTGGRILTSNTLGFPLDLGASWIHGLNGNPMTQLANELKIPLLKTDFESEEFFELNGKSVSDRAQAKYKAEFDRLIKQVRKNRDLPTVQAVIDQALAGKKLTEQQKDFYRYFSADIEITNGADLAALSPKSYDKDEELSGGDAILKSGYSTIVRHLASGLDIRLGEAVHAVRQVDNEVIVETAKGSHRGDYALLTLPLGVLKENNITFEPALPAEKTTAIGRMQMGLLNKTILVFKETFWPKKADYVQILPQKNNRLQEFLNLHKYFKQPVLMGFTGGSFAKKLENLSDAEVLDLHEKTLKSVFASDYEPPQQIIRTRWLAEPYSRGSYSIFAAGSTLKDHKRLAERFERLHFAGEATNTKYPGTVHGAYLSGVAAADEIIKL